MPLCRKPLVLFVVRELLVEITVNCLVLLVFSTMRSSGILWCTRVDDVETVFNVLRR